MPLAAWVLLATFTWCSYAHAAHAAPVPPVAAALSSPSQGFGSNNSEDDSVAQPEKRLLKYFHPGSQAWMDDGGDLYPISQEGSKRAYSDRNYLSDLGDYDNSDDETLNDSLEKRSRNFLRFGRPDMEDMFVAGGPMEFLIRLQDEADVKDLPFEKQESVHNFPRWEMGLKCGSTVQNQLDLFGRGGRNFLRLGRSVDRQLNSLLCHGPKTPGINPTPGQPKQDIGHRIEFSEPRERTQRTKRAAALTFYDYGSISSYSPSSWARGFQPQQEIITVSSEDPQDVNKRAYDRNFLRFGKRLNEYPSSESSGSRVVVVKTGERAPKRNFLRFG
ncbi:uncharacterized protein [Procambarus clarkii]|uniref:uncharacterized protein n=1 Tax=Procambarus clarkii TaxID=6728 RepID=UPI0037440ACE